jgi:hypothetical protein
MAPYAVVIAAVCFGERSEKKRDTVQLSNNSVERRIQDLVAVKQKKIGFAI